MQVRSGGERTRTADFYVANVALYQLSYTPEGVVSVATTGRSGWAVPRASGAWRDRGADVARADAAVRKAFENAAMVVAATGGSTNAALHLPAIAHECGIKFDLFDVAEIFHHTPYIADLKPGGKYVAKDMFEVGGIPLMMKTLLDHGFLHGDCLTVTGRSIAENLAKVQWNDQQDVVYPANRPITPTGGVVGLKGNIAPDGAIVKVAGMPLEKQVFTGPARCFDTEEACFEAVTKRQYKEGDVLVIRYEGPKGGPA